MTDLEDGFYWVRYAKDWEVAERIGDSWWRSGVSVAVRFRPIEIDPRRIVREGVE